MCWYTGSTSPATNDSPFESPAGSISPTVNTNWSEPIVTGSEPDTLNESRPKCRVASSVSFIMITPKYNSWPFSVSTGENGALLAAQLVGSHDDSVRSDRLLLIAKRHHRLSAQSSSVTSTYSR